MVRPIDQSTQIPQQPSVEEKPATSVEQGAKVSGQNAAPQQASSSTSSSQTQQVGEKYGASRMTEHSISGQARAAQLHSQVPEREVQGKVMQPVPEGDKAAKPAAAPSMQSVLQSSGMKKVSEPPSEENLRTYYANHAPAHKEIAAGKFNEAAKEYRRLADASKDPAEQTRLRSTANQLDIAETMQKAGVKKMSFPPSESNVQSYFGTMKGRPLNEIKDAFQGYAGAFYVHSETKGVDKGDVRYDKEKHTVGDTKWVTYSPEDWKDINTSREMHTDGRRIIDCEGYAYLGQKALSAAGFSGGQFAAAARDDNPKTEKNEQFSNQHIMYSARRTVKDADGKERTEVLAISNDKVFDGISPQKPSKDQIEATEVDTLTYAYRKTFRERDGAKVVMPGGIMVREAEAWRSQVTLDQALQAEKKPEANQAK